MNTAQTSPNPYLSAIPVFESKRDYNTCSFWCDNHPLTPVHSQLLELIPSYGSSDDPAVEVIRLAQNCYYDLYHNGGGNSPRWRMKRALKTAMRKAFTPESYTVTLESYEALMDKMDRDCFPIFDHLAMKRMEVFMTNVTYFCAKAKSMALPAAAQ